jgi:TonB family protein
MKKLTAIKLLCLMLMLSVWMISPREAVAQEVVYEKVDEMPVPPGGMDGLFEYMIKNLKYPKDAREAGIEGKVMVTFVVRADGSVSNSEILQGIDERCDQEALRVVDNMDTWTPGKLKGQAVATKMILPIQFKL